MCLCEYHSLNMTSFDLYVIQVGIGCVYIALVYVYACIRYFKLQPCSMSSMADIHPFVPADQAFGYAEMLNELERDLCQITGYDRVSFQPNRLLLCFYSFVCCMCLYSTPTKQALVFAAYYSTIIPAIRTCL